MKYSNILVPTDFSRSSYAAFAAAAFIAGKFKAKVYLLHVLEPIPVLAFKLGLSQAELDERVLKQAATDLKKAARRLRVRGAELLLRKGTPHKEIVRVVKEKKIDLIVMGTCGRTGLEHVLLGSVAEKVVRHAPCQVLTVKP